ncbi:MAG: hypothetical protein R2754_05265 [Microthrixaceae bacterium]
MDFVSVPDSGGFVVIDLPDAPVATGVVRWARKILRDGASSLARSLTYSYASLGMQVSGASAGVSAAPAQRDESVAAFVANLPEALGGRRVLLDAAKGINEDDLAPLRAADDRSSLYLDAAVTDALATAGVLAAADWANRGLDGARVTIDAATPATALLARGATAAGARVVALGNRAAPDGLTSADLDAIAAGDGVQAPGGEVADALAVDADVALVGAKTGAVDHRRMELVAAPEVVPYGRLAVTTRALAVAARANRRVLPDFVSTAGPLLAQWPAEDATRDSLLVDAGARVTAALDAVPDTPNGIVLDACLAAEEFLSTWCDELPFGRPI